jgi:hypothetical protein
MSTRNPTIASTILIKMNVATAAKQIVKAVSGDGAAVNAVTVTELCELWFFSCCIFVCFHWS